MVLSFNFQLLTYQIYTPCLCRLRFCLCFVYMSGGNLYMYILLNELIKLFPSLMKAQNMKGPGESSIGEIEG